MDKRFRGKEHGNKVWLNKDLEGVRTGDKRGIWTRDLEDKNKGLKGEYEYMEEGINKGGGYIRCNFIRSWQQLDILV